MAQAERLKNQAMSSGAESESTPFWERVKERPLRWRSFLHEVRVEMRQVTWPTQHEVITTTFVVIVAVAFFGIFFYLVDTSVYYVLNKALSLIKGH